MSDLKTFHEDVKRGNLEGVRASLATQPSLLNQNNEAGQSAFLLAKYYGQPAVASYLLTLNPKLDIFGACVAGLNGRVLAAIDGDPSLLAAHSGDGWTALHLTAFFGHAALAEALLDRHADADASSTNHMRNTPLHAAVAGRQYETAKVLLAHKANVHALQHGGWTALHGAAQNGDRAIVELLLAHGANQGARADNHQTPLDMALIKGHHEIATLLRALEEGSPE